MPTPPSTLDLAELEAGLAGTSFAGHVHAFSTVASTNTLAIEAAHAGVRTGVWVADEQTAGRGRGGHQWHSAAGDGLYVSVLLRPVLFGSDTLKISLAAGVAAVAAIGLAAGPADGFAKAAPVILRWPNDLLSAADGRKLGGILAESALGGDGRLSYAVVGIGINLNQRTMPPGLEQIATSLRMCRPAHERDRKIRRESLLPALLRALAAEVAALEREGIGETRETGILARFERASPMTRGTPVRVAEGGGYTGVTDGLDAHGLLRVRAEDGSLRLVRHGGVRALEPERP